MKKMILLMIFIPIILFSQQNVVDSLNNYAGWADNGIIKKQNIKMDIINYLSISDDKSACYIGDTLGNLIKFDLNSGKVISVIRNILKTIIGIYNDNILYTIKNDSLMVYNLIENKLIFSRLLFSSTSVYYDAIKLKDIEKFSFHYKNFIYVTNRYINDYGRVVEFYYKCKIYNCETNQFTTTENIPFEEGYQYKFAKDESLFCNFKFMRIINGSGLHQIKESMTIKNKNVRYTINWPLSYSVFNDNEDLGFISFGKYYAVMNLKTQSPVMIDSTNYPIYEFGVDSKNCMVIPDSNCSNIYIHYWNKINGDNKISLNDTLGKAKILKISDNKFLLGTQDGNIAIFENNKYDSLVADFSASKYFGYVGDEISFKNKSKGAITKISWDFGNGFTSTERDFNYLFTKPGKYLIKLGINSETDYAIVEKEIVILDIPKKELEFFADPPYGNSPLKVQFVSQKISSYESISWDFGDGGTSNEINPIHTFINTGTYKITQKIVTINDTLQGENYVNVFDNRTNYIIKQRGNERREGPTFVHKENYSIRNLTFLGNNSYAYNINYFYTDGNHYNFTQYTKNYFIKRNPYYAEQNLSKDSISLFFTYKDEGFFLNDNKFYNKNGEYLFTINYDKTLRFLINFNGEKFVGYNEKKIIQFNGFLEPEWEFNLSTLNSSINRINHIFISKNGDINVFYNDISNKKVYYSVIDKNGELLDNKALNSLPNGLVLHRNDDTFFLTSGSNIYIFDKNGNILKSRNDVKGVFSKLDSLYIISTICYQYEKNEIQIYDNDLNSVLYYSEPELFDDRDVMTGISAIILSDKSIIFGVNYINVGQYSYLSYHISRNFFNELKYPVIFVSVPLRDNNQYTLFPNPATDYIEINNVIQSEAKNPEIELYNIFGESLPPSQDLSPALSEGEGAKIRIDVSNLPAGVYFIRIGDRFEKFVKI